MALTKEQLARLRARSDAVKQQQSGSLSRYAALSGQRAIVEPGGTVQVRLLPRWDIAQAFVRDKAGKTTPNPKYDLGQDVFVEAFEHWYTNSQGQRRRDWCRRSLGPDEPCPLCEAVEVLVAGDEGDRESADDLEAKEVFLFNIVVRRPDGTTVMGEGGKPDVRILSAPGTVFTGIMDKVTGGGNEAFARGDIWDWKQGYDIVIARPPKEGGVRSYKVDCAVNPTPLIPAMEAQAWAGWTSWLHDLEAEVSGDNVKSYGQLYEAFHGMKPEASPGPTSDAGGADADLDPGIGGTDPGGEVASPGAGPEDYGFGMPPEEPAPRPPARRPPPRGRR